MILGEDIKAKHSQFLVHHKRAFYGISHGKWKCASLALKISRNRNNAHSKKTCVWCQKSVGVFIIWWMKLGQMLQPNNRSSHGKHHFQKKFFFSLKFASQIFVFLARHLEGMIFCGAIDECFIFWLNNNIEHWKFTSASKIYLPM